MGFRTVVKRILLFAFLLLLGFLGYMAWYYFPHTPKPFKIPQKNEYVLIAHAGGTFENRNYTNSLEAVSHSLDKGFRFIELDLAATSDKKVVAIHDWKLFHTMTGHSGKTVLSEQDFKNRRIYGDMTPLTSHEINKLFSDPSTVLVIDKLDDFILIQQSLNISPERILVEVFSYKKYKQALRNGIVYPMLCIWDEDSLNKHMPQLLAQKIVMITVPVDLIEKANKKLEMLFAQGIAIFAFTSNDKDYMHKYINRCVTGFYTDTVEPTTFRPAKER